MILFIIFLNKTNNNDLLNKIKDLEQINIQLTDKIKNLENKINNLEENNIQLKNLTMKINELEDNNKPYFGMISITLNYNINLLMI